MAIYFNYIYVHTHIYIYHPWYDGICLYFQYIMRGFESNHDLAKLGNYPMSPCASCRRSLESCLGRGCAWHRARFLRGTKRSGDVEVKGMSLWLVLTKQNRDTVQQWQQRPKNLLYRDRTFETQNVSTCMTLLNSRCITCPPFFGPFLPRRNTIVTIAWRTSSWRNWRRPHRRAWIREVVDFVLFHFCNTTPENRPPFLARDGNSGRCIPKV